MIVISFGTCIRVRYLHNVDLCLQYVQYEGGPVISGDDYCTECIFEDAKAAASADNYRDQRTYMKEVIEEVLNGNSLDDKTYLVSKPWLVSPHFVSGTFEATKFFAS